MRERLHYILEDDLDDEGNENIVVSLGDPVANAVPGAAVESDGALSKRQNPLSLASLRVTKR